MEILIEKHEYSDLIHKPEHSDFMNFVSESINISYMFDELKSTLDAGSKATIDPFDELDSVESSIISNYTAITTCANGIFSKIPAINTCIQNVCVNIRNYNDLVNSFLDLGIFLDENYRKKFEVLCNYINGALLYVLWYDYGINKTAYALESGSSDVKVDEAVKSYCNTKSLDLDAFITDISALHEKYHFVLSVFEDCPELEEQFISIVGPLLGAISESELTVEIVRAVCNGKLTPEELINKQTELETMDTF